MQCYQRSRGIEKGPLVAGPCSVVRAALDGAGEFVSDDGSFA